MKHPQITEEHAKDILEEIVSNLIFNGATKEVISIDSIKRLKQSGFIKKSPIEEIKERYTKWISECGSKNMEHEVKIRFEIIIAQHEAILELEKQIEEMKPYKIF